MANLQKKDLKFEYSWSTIGSDDPRLTGSPDNQMFNRNEGYEVLPFLNNNYKTNEEALKAERLIRHQLPGDVRSRKNVLLWLQSNWSKHP